VALFTQQKQKGYFNSGRARVRTPLLDIVNQINNHSKLHYSAPLLNLSLGLGWDQLLLITLHLLASFLWPTPQIDLSTWPCPTSSFPMYFHEPSICIPTGCDQEEPSRHRQCWPSDGQD